MEHSINCPTPMLSKDTQPQKKGWVICYNLYRHTRSKYIPI